MSGKVWIGTSGFTYPHWRGVLYPEGVPQRRWLEVYCETFPTVEVNATFYRLPTESTVEGWRSRTQPGFTFAVKGSRFITHVKRLAGVEEAAALFFSRVALLGEKLGPILFQLPPQLKADHGLLAGFSALLPAGYRCALEFRHPSWFSEGVFERMSELNLSLCLHDYARMQMPCILTTRWTYLRFHGPSGRYHGQYGESGVRGWADRIAAWLADGVDVFAYFNNDIGGNAVRDAVRLAAMVGRTG